MSVVYADFGRAGSGPPPAVREVAKQLARGELPRDETFDGLLPAALRSASSSFWTPVSVAARVGSWLDKLGVKTVLDVGAGPGKFAAVVAGLSRVRVVALEHRPALVETGRELCQALGVGPRITWVTGALGEVPLPEYGALYLYNPFGENVYGPEDHLDATVELTPQRYGRDVGEVLRLLQQAAPGTCLVTYNGFGAPVPPSWREVYRETWGGDELGLWRREAP